jgi:hypothetical protein
MDRRGILAVMAVVVMAAACATTPAAPGVQSASADASARVPSASPSSSGWATPRPTPAPTPVPSPVTATVDGVEVRTLALAAPSAPIDVAYAFGSIWIANHHSASVTRMEPDTMEVEATIKVGSGPGWFAVADTAIWVSNQTGQGLTRIDAHANTAGTQAGEWATCGRPVVALGSIWQPACDAHRIMRVDPKTYAVTDLEAGGRFGIAVARGGRLIVGGPKGLARLDPATAKFTEIGGPDGWVFASDGATVWSSNERELFRIRPSDGSVVATIPIPETMSAVFRHGHAWFATPDGLVDVDLATNRIVRTIHVGPLTALADAGDAIWATSYDANTVLRIRP